MIPHMTEESIATATLLEEFLRALEKESRKRRSKSGREKNVNNTSSGNLESLLKNVDGALEKMPLIGALVRERMNLIVNGVSGNLNMKMDR
jgi:hypothetical protein